MKTQRYLCISKLKFEEYHLKLLVLLIGLLMQNNLMFGQLSIINSDLRMVEIGNLQVQGICNIIINDTLNCSVVAIEILDDINNSIVLNHEFIYDQTTGIPNGMTWSRVGNEIKIQLGVFQANTIWKARIRLKDNSSNWTSWEEFLLN